MVSLGQMEKARELRRQGYRGLPRLLEAELVFGGPIVMAKAEWTFIKIYASGKVEPATEADLKDRYTDLIALEKARCADLLKKVLAEIEQGSE